VVAGRLILVMEQNLNNYMKKLIFGLLIISLSLVVIFFFSKELEKQKKEILSSYMKDLQTKIKRCWKPPRGDISKRIIASFKVDREGKVSSVSLIMGSGNNESDKAALHAIDEASPFNKLPSGLPEKVDIEFTFDYNVFGEEKDVDIYGPKHEQKFAKKPVSTLKINTDIIELKLVKREDLKKNDYFDYEKYGVDRNYSKYGDLIGGYFSNCWQVIVYDKKFDVDGDGIKEIIIATTGLGANGGPFDGYVIKNNKIILSFPLQRGDILPAEDGNGLVVKHDIFGETYACPDGYTLYRIVYENNMFKPIWEQEVRYIKDRTKEQKIAIDK